MSAIGITFACGHQGQASATADAAPVCHCGERQIRRVVARAPRFVGTCTGPYCETKAVDPAVVDLAPAGPLKLKPQHQE